MVMKWKYTQHIIRGKRSTSNTHMRPTGQPLPMCSPSDAILDGVNGEKKLPSVWLQIAYTYTHMHVHIVIDTTPCSPIGGKEVETPETLK